jgi:hypothetical protein
MLLVPPSVRIRPAASRSAAISETVLDMRRAIADLDTPSLYSLALEQST